MAKRPKTAVQWRGVWLDPQTRDQLVEVDKLVGPYVSIVPSQGSYSTAVGASAGTHAGGGAFDLSVQKLTAWQIQLVVFLLRRVGIAAWHRTSDEGPWSPHIHGINKTCPDLSPQAEAQVAAYKAKRNGLANDKADKHKALEAPYESTWESYLANWGVK
jgi:hypothetical protein